MSLATSWNPGRSVGLLTLAALAAACGDLPPTEEVQTGFRGTGMALVYDAGEHEAAVEAAAAALPAVAAAPAPGAPAPDTTWQNVQVLNDLSAEEFVWLMTAMTQWVSPEQGCVYCHVQAEDGSINMVSDDNYAKIVSRRMIQMVRHINADWTSHVRDTGVNCYTCHRGQPVPEGTWYYTGPNQGLRHYVDREDVRVQDLVALAVNSDNRASLKQTEYTYALMISMSKSLGVNCTFCHNTGRFGKWEDNPPQRVTALRGIRMLRDANVNYLVPLQDVWPPERLGPMGDGPKMQCSTCHQGAYRPIYGAPAGHATPQLRYRPMPEPEPVTPEAGRDGAEDADGTPVRADDVGAAGVPAR